MVWGGWGEQKEKKSVQIYLTTRDRVNRILEIDSFDFSIDEINIYTKSSLGQERNIRTDETR
jgi:hypothetical protein